MLTFLLCAGFFALGMVAFGVLLLAAVHAAAARGLGW